MAQLGLSRTIFLETAAVVTAVLVATLVVMTVSARRGAERAAERGLAETNARITDQLRARQAELAGRMAVFAQNRSVMQVIARDTIGSDALDQAGELVDASGARWVQITDAQGRRLARSDDRAAERVDLSGSPLVAGALEGQTTSGFGVSGDSAVVQLVALPLLRDLTDPRSVVGVIMAAQEVGDSLARSIGATTGSDVAFYVLDSAGAARLAGTTVAAEARAELQAAVAARVARDSAMRDTAATPRDSATSRPGARAGLTLDGTEFIAQRADLLSASGAPVGGVLVLRSLDAELSGYYDQRRALLLTGALGLLLAFVLSGMTARRIARPVTALVTATRRAAEGDYAAEIPAAGSDEIGTLAVAVRRLLADLRDKQALVEFLGGASGAESRALALPDDVTQQMPRASMPSTGALAAGSTLGARYDIRSLLGSGGMGMVYRAMDRELGELVAIKVLRPEMVAADTTALDRFRSEIRLARKISHRNVVRTHDIGEASGVHFITMEFVDGTSLKDLVRQRGRLPVTVMLPIAKQLCRALEVAHAAGVIHRDIKPQNMVVERDGTLKVMDFGIARLAGNTTRQGLTEVGMVVGTPEYMSPEQLLGDALDARTDLYSAGVVMYECLTGRVPFEAPSPMILISRVLEHTAAAPHLLHDDIPTALGAVVMRAMSRDRLHRYDSAEALLGALDKAG